MWAAYPDRLRDPSILEGLARPLLEVRLLAVEPGERRGTVFAGLMWVLYQYARRTGYSQVVISGLLDRQSLYEHMGFRPLGPAVQSGDAQFVPMILTLSDLPEAIQQDIERWQRHIGAARETRVEPRGHILPDPARKPGSW